MLWKAFAPALFQLALTLVTVIPIAAFLVALVAVSRVQKMFALISHRITSRPTCPARIRYRSLQVY